MLKNMELENDSSFNEIIEKLKTYYLKIWWETTSEKPVLGELFTKEQQRLKEKDLDIRMKEIISAMKKMPASKETQLLMLDKMKWAMRVAGGVSFGFTNDEISNKVVDKFSQTASDFIKEAKAFDSKIGIRDINQAIRNLWIANSIQILLDREIMLTPSTFAYSMLYPYTDNYLDNPEISSVDKQTINSSFRRRLAGEVIEPASSYENSLFRLVEIIESEHPRHLNNEVYESLLAIHEAQGKSILQGSVKTFPYEIDIMGISFEKGGTSVLADAYIIDPKLSLQSVSFMFGFGVFLQLVDDIEDTEEDYSSSHMTMFSQLVGKWDMDRITNRLINFISKVLETEENCPVNLHKLKDIIRNNSNFLIMEAIAKNSSAYSSSYVKNIEKYCPFRFSYMNKLRRKLKKQFKRFDLDSLQMDYTKIS